MPRVLAVLLLLCSLTFAPPALPQRPSHHSSGTHSSKAHASKQKNLAVISPFMFVGIREKTARMLLPTTAVLLELGLHLHPPRVAQGLAIAKTTSLKDTAWILQSNAISMEKLNAALPQRQLSRDCPPAPPLEK